MLREHPKRVQLNLDQIKPRGAERAESKIMRKLLLVIKMLLAVVMEGLLEARLKIKSQVLVYQEKQWNKKRGDYNNLIISII